MGNDHFWKMLEPEHAAAERFCRRLAGSVDEGDDLYQDALLLALRNHAGLQDNTAFRPWLYRIIINQFRNRRRWWQRRRETPLDPETAAHHAHDPIDRLTARRWLARGLDSLSAADRALIILFEIEGWSVAELAASLNTSQGTIKSRLSRSRKKMRQRISRLAKLPIENPSHGEAGYVLPQDAE